MFGRKYKREIAHFVQLSSKLGRRLGVARSRARQAEVDRDWWKERAAYNAATVLEAKQQIEGLNAELAMYKRAVQRRLEEAADMELPKYNIPINTRPGV